MVYLIVVVFCGIFGISLILRCIWYQLLCRILVSVVLYKVLNMCQEYSVERFEGWYPKQMNIGELVDRVLELEKKLEEVKNEGLHSISKSPIIGQKNVGKRTEGEWVKVVKKNLKKCNRAKGVDSSQRKKQGEDRVIPLSNKFEVLADEQEEKKTNRSKGGSNLVIIGDETVQKMDKHICGKDPKKRVRVCFPGAKIEDIKDRIDNCVTGEGENPVVLVCAGGNNVSERRSEDLIRKYTETLTLIKSKGGTPLGCGILPRNRVSEMWLSRAMSVNEYLGNYCRKEGIGFIDVWAEFCGKREMYEDSVRPSNKGVRIIERELESKLEGYFLGESQKQEK